MTGFEPLMSKVAALPTEPHPLPHFIYSLCRKTCAEICRSEEPLNTRFK